jgi:hypothetical protein
MMYYGCQSQQGDGFDRHDQDHVASCRRPPGLQQVSGALGSEREGIVDPAADAAILPSPRARGVATNGERQVRAHRTSSLCSLLVFPPGVLCSVDFTTAASATDGHKVKLYLRSLSTNSKLGTNDKETSQTFVPCYWLMRVLEDDCRLLKLDSAGTGGDTLEDAMQGMII